MEEIYKRQSLVPTPEHLAQADYEPSHRKYMLMCAKHESWKQGEREELPSIEKNCVWTREQPPYGTKVIPLKWVYKVKKNRLGAIQRYKCRLVAQGFFQVFGQDYTDTYNLVYIYSDTVSDYSSTWSEGTPDGRGYSFPECTDQ